MSAWYGFSAAPREGEILSREAIEQAREVAESILATDLADSHEALRADRDEWHAKHDNDVSHLRMQLAEAEKDLAEVRAERDRVREAGRLLQALTSTPTLGDAMREAEKMLGGSGA